MASIRGMKWAKISPWTRFWRFTVPNFVNDIRIRHWAKKNDIHKGTKQILTGGVWIDSDNKIYNCMGTCIGEINFYGEYRGNL